MVLHAPGLVVSDRDISTTLGLDAQDRILMAVKVARIGPIEPVPSDRQARFRSWLADTRGPPFRLRIQKQLLLRYCH